MSIRSPMEKVKFRVGVVWMEIPLSVLVPSFHLCNHLPSHLITSWTSPLERTHPWYDMIWYVSWMLVDLAPKLRKHGKKRNKLEKERWVKQTMRSTLTDSRAVSRRKGRENSKSVPIEAWGLMKGGASFSPSGIPPLRWVMAGVTVFRWT